MVAAHASKCFNADIVRDAVLRVLPETETLYAFGSRARGDARVDSDLDRAVLAGRPLESTQRFEAQRALSAQLDCDVNLIDLLNASSVLRSEVVNGGMPLYRRDPQRTLDIVANRVPGWIQP